MGNLINNPICLSCFDDSKRNSGTIEENFQSVTTRNNDDISIKVSSEEFEKSISAPIKKIQDKFPFKHNFNSNKDKELKNGTIQLQDNSLYSGQYSLIGANQIYQEGEGILSKTDGTVFEGIWHHGIISYGRRYDRNGNFYEGEFFNSLPDSNNGFLLRNYFEYKGEFRKGLLTKGKIEFINSEVTLTTEFVEGNINKGVYEWKNGSCYDGEMKNLELNGKGQFYNSNNQDVYSGQWDANKLNGYGHYIWADNLHEYKGNYKNGKRDGDGVYFFDQSTYFSGFWFSGYPHGLGNFQIKEKCYPGFWRYGKLLNLTNENVLLEKESIENEINNLMFNKENLGEDISNHFYYLKSAKGLQINPNLEENVNIIKMSPSKKFNDNYNQKINIPTLNCVN